MKVQWTEHAKRRAKERSGHPLRRLARRIEQAVRKGQFYSPGERIRRVPGEMWVVVDGPKGKATAIVQPLPEGLTIVTVRESETCQQGEGVHRGSGNFLFKTLLQGVLA
jgi:hypothetical protein